MDDRSLLEFTDIFAFKIHELATTFLEEFRIFLAVVTITEVGNAFNYVSLNSSFMCSQNEVSRVVLYCCTRQRYHHLNPLLFFCSGTATLFGIVVL